MALILASASPRRRRLLDEAGIAFQVHPVEVDETPPPGLGPEQVVLLLAERKARAAAFQFETGRVLAADTVVVLEGMVLGKPRDRGEAREMIARLSGRTHRVLTGVVLLDLSTGRLQRAVEETEVEFVEIPAARIDAYAAAADCLDKAGGYGIQGEGEDFVKSIRGSFSNVVGLPMGLVREMLS